MTEVVENRENTNNAARTASAKLNGPNTIAGFYSIGLLGNSNDQSANSL